MTALDLGREITGDLKTAERREWLVTNGIGGFASGTVAGLNTRRYHGLLLAALNPPLGRTMILARLDEQVTLNERVYCDDKFHIGWRTQHCGIITNPHGDIITVGFR